MVQFRKLDAERDGKLTHNEFKEVIGNLCVLHFLSLLVAPLSSTSRSPRVFLALTPILRSHLGLTPAQLTEVIRTSDPEQSQM